MLRWAAVPFLVFYALTLFGLLVLRWVNPPTTSVQMERRVESWFGHAKYRKRQVTVPLRDISPAFQHAVLAAEDARFYIHHGFDWGAIDKAAEADVEGKRLRGGSTITQQLVKNLYLTTSRSLVRKAVETTLVPFAELFLSKNRILELYLNTVEWGPGVYGAEAAARYHYGVPASRISREQGARLAAILPAPRRRRPAAMNDYSARILEHMRQVGW